MRPQTGDPGRGFKSHLSAAGRASAGESGPLPHARGSRARNIAAEEGEVGLFMRQPRLCSVCGRRGVENSDVAGLGVHATAGASRALRVTDCVCCWMSSADSGGCLQLGPDRLRPPWGQRVEMSRRGLLGGVLAHLPPVIVCFFFPPPADGGLRGRRSCQRIACVSSRDVFDGGQACGSRWVCISR